jgi:hypothetical protein
MISLIVSEYLCRVLYHTAYAAASQESVKAIPEAAIKGIALVVLWIVATLNILSNRVGTQMHVVLTTLKVS